MSDRPCRQCRDCLLRLLVNRETSECTHTNSRLPIGLYEIEAWDLWLVTSRLESLQRRMDAGGDGLPPSLDPEELFEVLKINIRHLRHRVASTIGDWCAGWLLITYDSIADTFYLWCNGSEEDRALQFELGDALLQLSVGGVAHMFEIA
ncbi:hypothetical protein BBO_09477 [Beauveria brongniartii RCEF 3172]|uniref:Uncharacterized protein n=1 Tax=Beauveria brongniartii RCEF 3172 TaxID=1081107 RepID=A0A168FDF6_9HYPO|nr:hypothetical protein BBO_09477 [Beauveria brongniartii RCEF 3172]